MSRIFLAILFLIFSSHLNAFYVTGGLLHYLNLVNKNSEKISIGIVNNEKQDNVFTIEYGEIEISKEGGFKLIKKDLKDLPIKGPEITAPIPAGGTLNIEMEISKPAKISNTNYLNLGFLISKVDKEVLNNDPTEQVKAGLKIINNFLVQVYSQLKRKEIGKLEVKEEKVTKEVLEFDVSNLSKELADAEIIVFPKSNNNSVGEPLKKKVRILSNHTRTLKFELPKEELTSALIFIDDPNFKLVQKEIKLK